MCVIRQTGMINRKGIKAGVSDDVAQISTSGWHCERCSHLNAKGLQLKRDKVADSLDDVLSHQKDYVLKES